MNLKKIGKKVAIVGVATGSVVGLVIAAPVLGPVGAIVIAGLSVGEALGLGAAAAVVVGGALVAIDEVE